MPGKIKAAIDHIVRIRGKGDEVLQRMTVARLVLKGIDPDAYDPNSNDDPAVISQLSAIAAEWGIKV